VRKLLLSLLVVSSFAFGETDAKRVCETVNRGNNFLGQQCYTAIDGRLFEASAVQSCGDIGNSFLVIECLKAIAMKALTSDEVSRCDGNSNTFLRVECFKTAGRNACH